MPWLGTGHERHLDPRTELSEFLRTRRARLKPADLGLAEYGRRRRVPGLRREELARLAGVSVAYYTRLEQGNARNVSVEVLDAISTRSSSPTQSTPTCCTSPSRSSASGGPRRSASRCGPRYWIC